MTTQKTKSSYNPTSPAVEQAAQLMLCLGSQEGTSMGLTAICKKIGIHKSKGFSILNALSRYDLVTKDDSRKTYSLGPALMPLARKAREKLDINDIAGPYLQKLANKTQASVLLGIISGDQLYISGKYDGNPTMSVTIRRHQSLHITHGAHGKAVFSFLDPEKRLRILDTSQTFFHGKPENLDREKLEQEIQFCRENGFAVDDAMLTPGIRALSSPLFDHSNNVAAAIVLVGTFPKSKFKSFGSLTAQTARAISKKAGATVS